MAIITLVRHGQATLGGPTYDLLSARGREQSQHLGHWLRQTRLPSAVIQGAMQRHGQTTAGIAETAGEGFPLAQTHVGFNEFDHEQVMARYRPDLVTREAMGRELAKHPHPAKAFHHLFSAAMARWVSGAHDAEYSESWSAFQQRVWSALNGVMATADNAQEIMIVTSGGPIAVLCQQVMALSNDRTLALNHVLANTGVTRLLFSGERVSLSLFNSVAHLEIAAPHLLTYR